MSELILLSKESARRVRRVVERDEMRPYSRQGAERPLQKGDELHPVQITDTVQTAGRYPGSLYQRDGNADTFTLLGTAGDIWVDTPNGETLAVSTYYYARVTGVKTADNRLIFEVVGTHGSGSSTFSGANVKTISPLPAGTSPVPWNQGESYDTDSYFTSAANTRLTVSTAGYYLVIANLRMSHSDPVQVTIQHIGDSFAYDPGESGEDAVTGITLASVSTVTHAAAGDYFVVNFAGTASVSYGIFSITKLG